MSGKWIWGLASVAAVAAVLTACGRRETVSVSETPETECNRPWMMADSLYSDTLPWHRRAVDTVPCVSAAAEEKPTAPASAYDPDPYEDGYDTGYDDGYDDRINGFPYGYSYDEDAGNDYRGRADDEYRAGYESGYEDGYHDY